MHITSCLTFTVSCLPPALFCNSLTQMTAPCSLLNAVSQKTKTFSHTHTQTEATPPRHIQNPLFLRTVCFESRHPHEGRLILLFSLPRVNIKQPQLNRGNQRSFHFNMGQDACYATRVAARLRTLCSGSCAKQIRGDRSRGQVSFLKKIMIIHYFNLYLRKITDLIWFKPKFVLW